MAAQLVHLLIVGAPTLPRRTACHRAMKARQRERQEEKKRKKKEEFAGW